MESSKDLIYRDPLTGQEVNPIEALSNISQGKPYIIKRRILTRQGTKEEPIIGQKEIDLQNVNRQKTEFIKSQAQDKLDTIAEIEKGLNFFGTFGQFMPKEIMTGTKYYTWKANLEKLLSGKMIELMIQMKEATKTGATGFGSLSEKEGETLREASTALKPGLKPQDAQKILNKMKFPLRKILGVSSGKLSNEDKYQRYLEIVGGK
jgi:hypothetical protein